MFYNAIGYAVEVGLLPANPVDRIQWKAPDVAETVDRRVVASPAQARALLAGVRAQGPRGRHLEAFYGCLYYAAQRPSEAVALREPDCHLPGRGWGRIDLAASEPRAGRGWTDDGTAREARGLKHRAAARDAVGPHPARPGRTAPRPPQGIRHQPPTDGCSAPPAAGPSKTAPTAPSGRPPATAVFTPAQQASPLARRPYDLRHAAVSLWLNSGVPATEVARRAGHSVAVLLKVYAHCIDGQADTVNKRIADALGGTVDSQDDQEP